MLEYTKKLKEELERIIKKENEPSAIMFSGGIDSTSIAMIFKELKKEFNCYTVGIENSKDINFTRKVAKELELPIKIKIFNKKEVIDAMKNVERILGYNDFIDVPVGTVTYLASKLANEKIVYSGLGSDEFLGGYQGHKIHGIKKEIEYRLKRIKVDIKRDEKICKYNNKIVKLPFYEIKDFLISIPDEFKIVGERNKVVLREMLKLMNVPKWIRERKKKAAQYGSGFSKLYMHRFKINEKDDFL